MKKSSEIPDVIEDSAPTVDTDSIMKRLEDVEERCTQLETSLKDTVTFDNLAVRLTEQKTVKKRRAKRDCHQKRKQPFMQAWWQGVTQKKKLDWKLPRLKL